MCCKPVPIPACLSDVNADWVADLLYKVVQVPAASEKAEAAAAANTGIAALQIRPGASQGFRESCAVSVSCSSQPDKTHRFIVEIIPSDPDLKDIIVKHNLFAREILVHEKVLPLLKSYVRQRSPSHKAVDVNFSVPTYIYGDYDAVSGRGVVVFQDYTEEGFQVDDEVLMLLEEKRVKDVVKNLATFHGICIAYETTEKEDLGTLFPILNSDKGSTWFQDDMTSFLHEMYSTCHDFLESIPGQEDLSLWFEHKMSNPHKLYTDGQSHPSRIRSLVHGDLWHNNIFFRQNHLLMTDWQMCHVARATNDLCFLLFSSTSPGFRKDHWDEMLRLYYNTVLSTIRSLSVTEAEYSLTWDEFLEEVRVSIPISLFFCGNIQDLDVQSEAAHARTLHAEGSEPEFEETLRRLSSCLEFFEEPEEHRMEFPDWKSYYTEDESGGIHMRSLSKQPSTEVHSAGEATDHGQRPQIQLFEMYARGLTKVPTIATDGEVACLELLRKNKKKLNLDPRKARAMRRKLYLDLYRDAVNKGLI